MNVVIYARYSSHNQTEQSIEGQIAVCKEYAKRNNFTIIGEYIDRALTGKNDKRPEFQKMIKDSNKKKFNGVLVYQLDRFSRSREDSAIYKAKLKKNNVRVFSAKENISEDASGVIIESLLEGMAEYYSLELSQKVKRGFDISAAKFLYKGGIVPLGFKIDEEKKYQIDEEKAKIVKNIFTMYVNGKTLVEIVDYLNINNIKNANGSEFKKTTLSAMLKNKRYIGSYVYNGKETKNAIPRIIDDVTFEKVQNKLIDNKRYSRKNENYVEYILTTKLFCGNCNEMMVGGSGTSRTGVKYHYYCCNGKKKKMCKRKPISKEYIEELVINQARLVLEPQNIEKIVKAMMKKIKAEKNNSKLKNLEKGLNDTQRQKINLLNSLRECNIEVVRKSIYKELEKIENEIIDIEQQIIVEKANKLELNENQIRFFLNSLAEKVTKDVKYERILITAFIDKIYIYDDKVIITFNIKNKIGNIETKEIPTIDNIESSFNKQYGEPNCTDTNFLFYKYSFAIRVCINIKK